MKHNPPRAGDDLVILVLRSIALFPSSRRLAWRLGPDLFRDPAARALAGCLLSGQPLPRDPRSPELRRLIASIAAATVPPPDDPEWGLHLVRLLAEREHLPLLIEMLQWAAWAVGQRQPLPYVLRRLVVAFAAAMGTRPLDARPPVGAEMGWRQ